ncbi:short chain dehydrogenase [Gluconobacter japonicus]|nr:short chain dehydrogenase [Gluconobacter japonicus]
MNRRKIIGGTALMATLSATSAISCIGVAANAHITDIPGFRTREVRTVRHRTTFIKAGLASGPLMIFVRGHPELAITWKWQMAHFARKGWRCVTPDIGSYGGSSVPASSSTYTVRKILTDMAELHDALGGAPAIWIGHDWTAAISQKPRSPVVTSRRSNAEKRSATRCRMASPRSD